MLYQLIFTILLLFYFYSFGLLFRKVLPNLNSLFSLTILNGMIGVGMIGLVSAFFIPLNLFFEITLILIAIIGLFLYRNDLISFIKYLRKVPSLFYFMTLLGLFVSVTYPYILDHFGYYIPTIKWLDFAGFVKGMSNLEWVFVQNSFWHILEAAINQTLDVFYRLNFILFLVYNLYLVERKSYRLLPLNLLFLFFVNTPSPDLPVMVISVILLNEYLLKPQKTTSYLFYATILFLIKPISIGLIFFFLIEYFRKKEFKQIKDCNLFLISFLAILFCLKGIVLAANPLFPMSFTSIESLSWSSPKMLYSLSESSGKFIPLKELYTFDEVVKMSKIDYLKNILFANVLRSRLLLFILLLNTFLFMFSLIYNKNKIIKILMFSLCIKVVFILITSPQYRFLFDVFVIDVMIILCWIKKEFFQRKWITINLVIISFLTVMICSTNLWSTKNISLATVGFIKNFETKLFLKPGQYDDVKYSSNRFGNFVYNYPTSYPLVYSTQVPAVSFASLNWYFINNGFPQLINPKNVKDGFYWKKLTDDEMKYLEKLIIEEQKKQVK